MSRIPVPPTGLIPFRKPWLSCADQVTLLQSRGLIIANHPAAEALLAHLNYYRFSGYCLAFEQTRHVFRPATTFDQVRFAYEFDQVLRDLMAEALEVVEVDFRTTVAHHFGHHYGALGHTSASRFHASFKHQEWCGKLRHEAKRSNELFVVHFKSTYSDFPDLPIWMLTEVMSFGSVSMMFVNMLKPDRRAIAARYTLQAVYLESWLHHLVYVRNLCAHHARLWDRIWAIKPKLPTSNVWSTTGLRSNDRLFVTLLILNQLLKACIPVAAFRAQWRANVVARLANPPACPNPLDRMGLTANWMNHPLWQ